METWSVHQLYEKAEKDLGHVKALSIMAYATRLIDSGLPVVFSLRHLSQIIEIDTGFLKNSIERKLEAANYRIFVIRKRSGGRRYIHAVTHKLFRVHKFINSQILQKIKPHPSSYAFHSFGGILKCAQRHCGAKWLIKFDLKNFFYSVDESTVYKIFLELGYSKILSFELASLCTTTRVPSEFKPYMKIAKSSSENIPYIPRNGIKEKGILPQGAPTSPMLSDLSARALDIRLSEYSNRIGFVYTRYADDLFFSARALPPRCSIGNIRYNILKMISSCGFKENKEKFVVAGPGSIKCMLGLLVDGDKPRISKNMRHRIDRLLHAVEKFGIQAAAAHEKFETPYGFQNHMFGLLSYVKSVDREWWDRFDKRMRKIAWL